MTDEASIRAVRELIDAVAPVPLLRRAGEALARGHDWGLLVAPSDELGVVDARTLLSVEFGLRGTA